MEQVDLEVREFCGVGRRNGISVNLANSLRTKNSSSAATVVLINPGDTDVDQALDNAHMLGAGFRPAALGQSGLPLQGTNAK